jgi:hypothetical protein
MNWRAWALALAVTCSAGALPAVAAPVDFRGEPASADARDVAAWISRSGDAYGKPFAIVDKKAARILVFDARHRLVGSSAVLLGQTVGDHTVEGVGDRAQVGQVGLHERTTPAGRFESVPGRNLEGEDVLWLDYDAAFAIHRVRPGAAYADRLARLKSSTPSDNRASLGCVVVPVDFYLGVVQPVLGRTRAVVYVLPETRRVDGLLVPRV